MSVNREHVVWKTRDGTWGIGFFDFYQTGDDYEWDIEYDRDTFNWCSIGHASQEDAHAAWEGANPGGGEVIDTPNDETDSYDVMASKYLAQRDEPRWMRVGI